MRWFKIAAAACLGFTAACTPGAPSAPNNALQAGTVVIHLSLGKYAAQTQYGTLGGYSPNPLVIARGSVIQFVNDDNFDHTASSVGQSGFPAVGPPGTAIAQSGTDLAQPNWSTGDLKGGSASQSLSASQPGTYYFGCLFHFNSQTPMRGVIVVQ